jgi:hypothetical protein
MSNSTPEPEDIGGQDVEDQDAEPSLNAPEEGRPDGIDTTDDQAGSDDADD